MSDNEYENEYGAEETPQVSVNHLSVNEPGHKPLARKQSMGGASRRSSRAPSAVEWDDDEREERHLLEHNAKLKEQVRNLKKTIRGLKEGAGGDLSANDEKSIETLNAESESYQADIEKYKEKARKVNDIELLDTLLDDLSSKQIVLKGLQVQRRQLGDAKRSNMKNLKANEDTPSRQKVFLELKDERRRQNMRLNAAQERKEKLAEQISLIQKKAEEAMAKADDLGLTNVQVASVVNMKKKDEEQVKQIDKLRSQIGAINGSFETMKTKTNWADRDKDVVLEDLRSEIEKVKAQIEAKEQLIVSNQGAGEKPPHFVQPLAAKEKPSPRRPPPRETSSKPAKKESSKALKPAPPPKTKKKESPKNKHQSQEDSKDASTKEAPPEETAADELPPQDEAEAEYSDDYNSPSPKKKGDESIQEESAARENYDDEYADDE